MEPKEEYLLFVDDCASWISSWKLVSLDEYVGRLCKTFYVVKTPSYCLWSCNFDNGFGEGFARSLSKLI